MGLRILSLSSLLADSMSVFHLISQGLASVSSVQGLLWLAGTVLPTASVAAFCLVRHFSKPSAEALHQLASFEIPHASCR